MLSYHPRTQFHVIKTTLGAMEEIDLEHGNIMKQQELLLNLASHTHQEKDK